MIPVHFSTLGDMTDDFDFHDAREDEYQDRQRVRRNRRARQERKALEAARKKAEA